VGTRRVVSAHLFVLPATRPGGLRRPVTTKDRQARSRALVTLGIAYFPAPANRLDAEGGERSKGEVAGVNQERSDDRCARPDDRAGRDSARVQSAGKAKASAARLRQCTSLERGSFDLEVASDFNVRSLRYRRVLDDTHDRDTPIDPGRA